MNTTANNVANEEITCIHSYTVYPKSKSQRDAKDNVWMVCRYKNVADNSSFSATGFNLPENKKTSFVLRGYWKRDPSYGLSFVVESHDIILPTGEEGVVSYLSSLRVRIGKGKAKLIYRTFGDQIWK